MALLTRPDLVIFDCDGVIVDSETPLLHLLHAELTAAGSDISIEDLEPLVLGGTVPDIVDGFRDRGLPLEPDWAEVFYDRLYARLAAGTPLIDGVDRAIAAVVEAGLSRAIGSNGRGAKMEITLGQHPQVRAAFGAHVYSGQDLGMVKPAPDLYLHIADLFGVAPARAVVIEDSPTGARAAKAAGMRCLGYAGAGDSAGLAGEGAEVFHDMAQVPGLLGL